jgi:O-antigen ligase
MLESGSPRSQYVLQAAGWSAVLLACFLPLSTSLSDMLFLLTAALVLASGIVRHRVYQFFSNPAALCFIILSLLLLLGTLYSPRSWSELSPYLLKMSRMLVVLFILPLFFFSTWRRRVFMGFAVAALCVLVCVYLNHFQIIDFHPRHHPVGIFKDYIVESIFYNFLFFVCVYKCMMSSRRWVRVASALIAAALFFEIVFISPARTGLVVFVVLLVYSCLFYRRRAITYAVLALILLGALGTYFSSTIIKSRVETAKVALVHHDWKLRTSVGFRVLLAKRSWHLIEKKPWFGYGTGSIRSAYHHYNVAHPRALKVISDDANNTYINFLLEYGVVGLCIYVGLLAMLWRCARCLPEETRYYLRMVLLMLVVGGLFNSWLKDSAPGHFFLIFISLLFGGFSRLNGDSCSEDFRIE